MDTTAEELAVLLAQYQQERLEYLAWFEQQLQLLQTLKHGVELLLLVVSYLIYYLADCVAEVLALSPPNVF
ncbi:MAG: hypothetical protein A3I02_01550 [Betaproteobacteria bacterium RIFCSPLOWO2_02_FULL_67_26]|nr:MAG: hypothetical protein A3I02_01550 [Betaproteobacteria bacterium RIFCSPLOWO2_02_FULL_67_26]